MLGWFPHKLNKLHASSKAETPSYQINKSCFKWRGTNEIITNTNFGSYFFFITINLIYNCFELANRYENDYDENFELSLLMFFYILSILFGLVMLIFSSIKVLWIPFYINKVIVVLVIIFFSYSNVTVYSSFIIILILMEMMYLFSVGKKPVMGFPGGILLDIYYTIFDETENSKDETLEVNLVKLELVNKVSISFFIILNTFYIGFSVTNPYIYNGDYYLMINSAIFFFFFLISDLFIIFLFSFVETEIIKRAFTVKKVLFFVYNIVLILDDYDIFLLIINFFMFLETIYVLYNVNNLLISFPGYTIVSVIEKYCKKNLHRLCAQEKINASFHRKMNENPDSESEQTGFGWKGPFDFKKREAEEKKNRKINSISISFFEAFNCALVFTAANISFTLDNEEFFVLMILCSSVFLSSFLTLLSLFHFSCKVSKEIFSNKVIVSFCFFMGLYFIISKSLFLTLILPLYFIETFYLFCVIDETLIEFPTTFIITTACALIQKIKQLKEAVWPKIARSKISVANKFLRRECYHPEEIFHKYNTNDDIDFFMDREDFFFDDDLYENPKEKSYNFRYRKIYSIHEI